MNASDTWFGCGARALVLACNGGGSDDTGSETGGPTSAPTGDPTGDPTTAPTRGPDDTGGTSPSDPTLTSATLTDPTTDPDPTASPTNPTGTTGIPDPGDIVEPGDPGPGDVTFTIRADEDRHPISKHFYGSNQPGFLTGMGLVRQGGNRPMASQLQEH